MKRPFSLAVYMQPHQTNSFLIGNKNKIKVRLTPGVPTNDFLIDWDVVQLD